MKTTSQLAWGCMLALASQAFGQGTIRFDNRVVGKPMYDVDGTTRLNQTYIAGLYLEGLNTPLATAVFRTDFPGFFAGGDVSVPGAPPGVTVTVQVRFWDIASGATYEAAEASATGKFGFSNKFTVVTGNGFGFGAPVLEQLGGGGGGLMTDLGSSSLVQTIYLTHGIAQAFTDAYPDAPSSYQPASLCGAIAKTKWYRLFGPDVPGWVYLHTYGTSFDAATSVTAGSPIHLEQNGIIACGHDGTNQIDPTKKYSVVEYVHTNGVVNFLAISSKTAGVQTSTIQFAFLPNPLLTATDLSYSVAEDGQLSVTAAKGLVPATYASTAHVETAAGVTHGALLPQANGAFIYKPGADYFGPDQFSFRLTDGTFYSTANVSLTVTPVIDPLRFLNMKRVGTALRYDVIGGRNESYEIQASSTLPAISWEHVTNIVLSGGSMALTNAGPSNARFYRGVSR